MLEGFKKFIFRGNVIDLAVGVIIGSAFGAIVNSLVADILTPLIGMIFGTPDFSGLKLGALNVGKFINAVVSFLMVGFALYFFVVTPMNKLQEISRKKEPEVTPASPPEEIILLREIRDALKR
ncbi:large conductance mechanosensitive channel protein MscL [Meiothermus ruber]|jgi:large conductance mechanosensitive channel|uniref:Large-conductance mechanosensitive channel n=1 Tax=Meiothermus ruber (strain ATCC 35948 / DSM 1279 / VKM B-1258 / 21) TaxID=504728 RepID=D3PR45_MEIRD|nr:large conductance mechanosensitive channel protein MscL [Meiothermus ruber]ADD27928.1 large conductance mechanosensitive channel protein [Meiothermus ruber DSM 1279]AGK04397.1 large conductance mechanosensitive channel protein [Meiothermus ruber DSM 1279]MCL6531230.1 large conductance mechanosensitive channel protein MscL [Meiothermus ruber]GAO74866.1 large conductance mechanosensitive channel protein [Meiothermus ruber H328]